MTDGGGKNLSITHLRLDTDGIHIVWSDGAGSQLPYRFVRGHCPCAICVLEGTNQRVVFEKDVPEDVIAVDWMAIGRYAVQFLWSDAHETGIFPFNYLIELQDKLRKH
jgi:DUF971 family protein